MRVSTANLARVIHLHNTLSHIVYGIGTLVTALHVQGLQYSNSNHHHLLGFHVQSTMGLLLNYTIKKENVFYNKNISKNFLVVAEIYDPW